MKIVIIGLGLIGGSIAKDLKKRNFANHIYGVDINPENAELALKLKIVDEIVTLEQGIDNSELIIIATPVDATILILPEILNRVKAQTVTDMGSTKEQIIESIRFHPNRKNFVASHPMAGTEFSGPSAALSGLFDHKTTILCNVEESSEEAVNIVRKMYDVLKMDVVEMTGTSHDVHVAYVSHISHISSFALALTVMDIEEDEKNIFNLASGGFESTVRLAKSSADTWAPIFMQNNKNVLTALNNYIDKLQELKIYIKEQRIEEMYNVIKKSNRIKEILNK
ncbi:MAG TPA: prephenate dehydrogenase [Bacteroidales bacterium]